MVDVLWPSGKGIVRSRLEPWLSVAGHDTMHLPILVPVVCCYMVDFYCTFFCTILLWSLNSGLCGPGWSPG